MNDSLGEYIRSIKHLPAAPIVLIRLIALFRETDRDVDEIVRLMSQDPSLTAEVLKKCNSAALSGGEPVLDIFDAIMRLGFYEVYQTSVTMFGMKTMTVGPAAKVIEVDRLWRHSLATGMTAGRIAKDLGESEGIAYTAGLLHDVGKIVIASAEGARYAEMLRACGNNGAALEDAETNLFGFGHGAVGARLLSDWGVPLDVSMPVFCHHQPQRAESYKRLAAIVCLGNYLAHWFEVADETDINEYLAEAESLLKFLDCSKAQIADIATGMREEVEAAEQVFTSAAAA